MRSLFRRLYARFGGLVRYALVGGLTTAVNVGCFALLHSALGLHYQAANVAAWVLSVLFAFAGSKWFVFRDEAREPGALLRQLAGFFGSRLLTLLVETGLMWLLVTPLGMDAVVAKVLCNAVVIVLNFVLSKRFVFRSGKDGEADRG